MTAKARRGLPRAATLLTVLMVPVLIGLGFWQLDRRAWKAALNAELAAAPGRPMLDAAALDAARDGSATLLYRRVQVDCTPGTVAPYDLRGGESASGEPGFLVLVNCTPAQPGPAWVLVAGWTPRPEGLQRVTVNGRFDGMVIDRPYGRDANRPRFMVIARQAVPPLAPSRLPTPGDLPDNHLSYAIQWFGFAGVLLTIYGLYVRRWRRGD